MKLKEYLSFAEMDVKEFSFICEVSVTSLYGYLAGKKPRFKTARKIKKATGGRVSIKELTGKEEHEYTAIESTAIGSDES